MEHLPKYILTASLLLLSAYMKSPMIAVSSILLWGLSYAENVLLQKNRDLEIVGLIQRMEKVEQKSREISQDVMNVAERAKTILGENY